MLERRPHAEDGYLGVAGQVPKDHPVAARALAALGVRRQRQGREDDAVYLLAPLLDHPAVAADRRWRVALQLELLWAHAGKGDLAAFDAGFAAWQPDAGIRAGSAA